MRGLALLLIFICTAARADIHHRVTFDQRHLQQIVIESEFAAPADELILVMANWTPGSYKIRDFSRNVEGFTAESLNGQPLRVDKPAKNRWRIETPSVERIRVRYRVYAAEMTVRTSWVDDEFALINGASVFLVPADGMGLPQYVELVLPDGWSRVATALPPLPAGGYRAADYDELVDSPIAAGNPNIERFEVRGVGHQLVDFGASGLWDSRQAAEDISQIAEQQAQFWGQIPYRDDYLFFNFQVQAGGGLEHLNSTVLMTRRWQMREREDYLRWLGLVSHELFHAWNVKRLRPVELGPFDYEDEVHTRSLWIAEGLTNYYEPLFVSRAGLMTPEEYLMFLAEEIHRLETTPGRRIRSAEQASEDAWIKLYQPDANSVNSTISYYNKGALIGFLLDAKIRQISRNAKSLDDVMRTAYQRYSGDQGYTTDQFKALVLEIAGSDLSAWVERLTDSTEELDYRDALDWFGLALDRHPEKTQRLEDGEPVPAELGVRLDESARDMTVKEVLHDTPAALAGIIPHDEIIAINGQRVSYANWSDWLERLRVGEIAEVTLARRERLRTVTLEIGEKIPEEFEIKPREDISRTQRRNLETWLGQPVEPASR